MGGKRRVRAFRVLQQRRHCLAYASFFGVLIFSCYMVLLLVRSGPWEASLFPLQSSEYHLPDIDGTKFSCRCGRGVEAYQWPPRHGPQDLLCPDDTYDLTLCIKVIPSATPMSTRLHDRLQALEKDLPKRENIRSEEEEKEREKDALLRWFRMEGHKLSGGQGGYDMYPLAINLTDTLDAVTHGRPAPYAPITNLNIRLLRTSRTVCGPQSGKEPEGKSIYDLVVVYRTAVYQFVERSRIRRATRDLPPGLRVVFSVGLPRTDGGGNFFHMNGGFDLLLPERAGAMAKHWANRSSYVRDRILAEADDYGDIIVGDYIDTYVNLTYKLITDHRWASAFCQGKSDVFLFIDDDFEFNAKNILRYLAQLTRSERRQLLSAPLMLWRRVIRPFRDAKRNKWAVMPQEVPWGYLPPYGWGAASLIGAEVLTELVVAEAYTRFLWVDDAFLGFVVAKLPSRKFQNMRGFYLESTNNEKALVYHVPLQYSFRWMVDNFNQFLYNIQ